MTRTRLGLAVSTIIAAGPFYPQPIQAQGPAGSSAREIPNEVQKAEPRVDQVIDRANDHFRKGKLNLEDNKREQARDEFDKAVDEILMSGLDVRASQRLQTFYLELVERIYREEVPVLQTAASTNALSRGAECARHPRLKRLTVAKAQEPKQVQIGFLQQGFDPSPLDPLSKLILNEQEKKVSESDIAELEQAKNSLDFNFTINPLDPAVHQLLPGTRPLDDGSRPATIWSLHEDCSRDFPP